MASFGNARYSPVNRRRQVPSKSLLLITIRRQFQLIVCSSFEACLICIIKLLPSGSYILFYRFQTLMFPPYLFEYISNELKKNVILVLNKIDLVPASVVVAWKQYLQEQYPNIQIISFTSFPSYNLRSATNKKTGWLEICTSIL